MHVTHLLALCCLFCCFSVVCCQERNAGASGRHKKGDVVLVGDAFNPRLETCCGVKAFPRASFHRYNQCGGNAQFDRTEEKCCEGVVYPLQVGFGCCGDKYVEAKTNVCCPDLREVRPIPETHNRTRAKFLRCCGSQIFDVSENKLCCAGELVERGSPDSRCCGNATFDPNTHKCCGGQAHPTDRGKANYCCGDQLMDARQQICCWHQHQKGPPTVLDVPSRSQQIRCCGGQAWNFTSQVCCRQNESEMVLREKQGESHQSCCGETTYDSRTHVCCNNSHVVEKLTPNDNKCCGVTPYNQASQICCSDPTVNANIAYSRSFGPRCCGAVPFNPRTATCLNRQVLPLRREEGSCKDEKYLHREAICCWGNLVRKADDTNGTYACCKDKSYVVGKEICCEGQVRPISEPGQDRCCLRYYHSNSPEWIRLLNENTTLYNG